MKGNSRNLGFFIAFVQLFIVYRNDRTLFGLFPIICILYAVKSFMKMKRDIELISNDTIRSKVMKVEYIFCALIVISAYFVTTKVSLATSIIVILAETLLYISYISPKVLNRKFY